MSIERASESVWDYPRPPRVEPDSRVIHVEFEDTTIARSNETLRVLETSHPPVFYIPPADVDLSLLQQNRRTTFCEFKGQAVYWDLLIGERRESVGWSYPYPSPGFEAIKDMIAFYPSRVDCYVDGQEVVAQEGDFYGGWITSEIRGPFKGGPGTGGW